MIQKYIQFTIKLLRHGLNEWGLNINFLLLKANNVSPFHQLPLPLQFKQLLLKVSRFS